MTDPAARTDYELREAIRAVAHVTNEARPALEYFVQLDTMRAPDGYADDLLDILEALNRWTAASQAAIDAILSPASGQGSPEVTER